MKQDLFTEDRPVYLQLYERLRGEIVEGIYPYGARFPSKRVLADRYQVSLITVEHSLSLLCDEGYLETRQRSGSYVIFREGDLYSPAAPAAPVAMPAVPAAAEVDFPLQAWARIMRRVITDYGRQLLERVPGSGAPELKRALCDYLARSRGIRIRPEQLVIGAGSEYLYGILVQLFGREARFAIEKPSYSKIEQVYRANGADPELLSLGKDGILSSALAESRAQLLHITPYRSYPSGITTSASKRREYLRWAEQRKGWIIEDDFESEFSPSSKPEETLFAQTKHDNVIYLNSFTQTIAPSVRIAYLILPESLAEAYEQRLGFYACPVPAFDQFILAEFISGGEFERHLNRVRRKRRRE